MADILDVDNNLWSVASEIRGNNTGQKRGRAAVAYATDANKTLTADEYECYTIDIAAGVVSTTRNLVFPLNDGARWFVNNGTGQSIQCIGATGTGVTIATVKGAEIWCDGTNIKRGSADVTV